MEVQGAEAAGEAAQAVAASLQQIPDVTDIRVDPEPRVGRDRADLLVVFRWRKARRELLAAVKASGEPRHARAAVDQLRRLQAGQPDAYGLFVAPYIPDASAAICAENQISYMDLAGNCRLDLGSIFFASQGKPNPFVGGRIERIELSAHDSLRMIDLLENPPEPTEKLRAAARAALGPP